MICLFINYFRFNEIGDIGAWLIGSGLIHLKNLVKFELYLGYNLIHH
jgi:hypothetical protein